MAELLREANTLAGLRHPNIGAPAPGCPKVALPAALQPPHAQSAHAHHATCRGPHLYSRKTPNPPHLPAVWVFGLVLPAATAEEVAATTSGGSGSDVAGDGGAPSSFGGGSGGRTDLVGLATMVANR